MRKPHFENTISDGDWAIARRMIRNYFANLRLLYPSLTVSELLNELALPDLPWLRNFAVEAGFFQDSFVAEYDHSIVLSQFQRGVWSPIILSQETGIPLERVITIVTQAHEYGVGAYGLTPYGHGNRDVSDGNIPVLRRVSVVGQMCYRGHSYSLGNLYRGRTASVMERGPEVIVSFGDRPTLHLAKRISNCSPYRYLQNEPKKP
jgi:hypothetical protein